MPVVQASFVMVADPVIAEDAKQRLEAAMVKAIEDALAEGVTDHEVIRERILAARDAAR